MTCTPCEVTYREHRYQIDGAGNVSVLEPNHGDWFPVERELAAIVCAEAGRQRRNRARRERHQALLDLGLKRVRGNLGGTYYE